MLTRCMKCNAKFEVDDKLFGQEVTCQHCQHPFRATWHVESSSLKTIDLSSDDDDAEHEEITSDSKEKRRKSKKQIVAEQTRDIESNLKSILPKIQHAVGKNENESGTRLILDLLLQNVLSYTLEDIKTEQNIQGKKADYVLSVKGQEVIVVELKKVNKPLKNQQIFQATSYGAHSGIKWVLLTNLIVWQLYRIKTAEKIETDLVFTMDLSNGINETVVQYFYLLSKYGISRKGLLEQLWQKVIALSKEKLINAILSENIISKIRQILIKETGSKLTDEEVRSAIEKDVLQLD